MRRKFYFSFLMATFFVLSVSSGYAQKTVDKSFEMKGSKGRFTETIAVYGEIHSYSFQISAEDSGKTWSLQGRTNPNISMKIMKIVDNKMIRIKGIQAHANDWRQKLEKGNYKLLVSASKEPSLYYFTVELK